MLGSDGRIIASSEPRFRVGEASPVAIDVAALEADGDLACIRVVDGRHVAIGAALSKGYREYKTSDGHSADVVTVCAVPLDDVVTDAAARPLHSGQTAATTLGQVAQAQAMLGQAAPGQGEPLEVASFHIGRYWLGVKARDVVEAVDVAGLKPSARQAQDGLLAGYKLHDGEPVPVLRLARLLDIPDATAQDQQIVIVRAGGRRLGLLTDMLGLIAEIPASELQPLRDLNAKADIPALGVVAARDAAGAHAGMLMILDIDRLGLGLDSMPAPLRAAE